MPREADAAAQLRRARAVRREGRSEDPAERTRVRSAAIEAYRAVRLYFPDASDACAEAAFRAGELLRAADEPKAALAEFEVARERGMHTPFGVRAVLEIGHVERRAGRFADALAAYEAVFAQAGALPGQRDEAALWIGRVYVDTQRAEDARRTWQRVADGAEDPLDRVRAWDGIAGLSIVSGDLEGAAGVLERCRDALAEVSCEETRLGERVRSALAGMRSIDDLARAVTERARAKSDASTPPKKSVDTDLPHRRTDRL